MPPKCPTVRGSGSAYLFMGGHYEQALIQYFCYESLLCISEEIMKNNFIIFQRQVI